MAGIVQPHSPAAGPGPEIHSIELKLREISQLFNSLDPSPFNEQDLDKDAEEFIVGWARELPRNRPLHLILHLERPLPEGRDAASVADAIHHYFAYRASITRLELRQLLKRGRTSLIIGTAFLWASSCLAGSSRRTRLGRRGLLPERGSRSGVGWQCGAQWRYISTTGGLSGAAWPCSVGCAT